MMLLQLFRMKMIAAKEVELPERRKDVMEEYYWMSRRQELSC